MAHKPGGAVDMHSAHEGWICVFVYETETDLDVPLAQRHPFEFSEVFCGHVFPTDYRLNGRGTAGTRTATLDQTGLMHFRKYWVYASNSARQRQWFRRYGTELPDLTRQATQSIEYGSAWYGGPGAS